MPTAPLYYQPLVHARVLATPIGETTVHDAFQEQQKLTMEQYREHGPAMQGIIDGFDRMQAELPGSRPISGPLQLSFSEAGYLANRVATTLRLHPELFDTASPDQAVQMGANLVQEAAKELATNPGMRVVGDTMEVDPRVTAIMQKHWQGKAPLHAEEAAYLGISAARELQRAVTPLKPDETHPQLQWMEDGTNWLLGSWPGVVSRTVAALGVKTDAAEVEQVVDGWRGNLDMLAPGVGQNVDSVTTLLGAAGIAGGDDAARQAAFQVLQATPLEGVPAGIAQSIIASQKLPEEKAGYVAGRIVETGGTKGNIAGLLAELELMKQPAPGVPPPVDEPPTGEEPPPAGAPAPTPPPGEEPPAPVDPPKQDPAPADPPPAAEPPAGESPPAP